MICTVGKKHSIETLFRWILQDLVNADNRGDILSAVEAEKFLDSLTDDFLSACLGIDPLDVDTAVNPE